MLKEDIAGLYLNLVYDGSKEVKVEVESKIV